MVKLNVCSLNVHGIGNINKRRKIFRFLRDYNADINFLQETHGTNSMDKYWTAQWGSSCVFANYKQNARGVAFLFSKKATLLDVIRDIEGRYLICKIQYENDSYCIANVYVPNKSDPTFFHEVFTNIIKMEADYWIIGGDFNLVLDPELDRKGNYAYNQKSVDYLTSSMEMYELIDIWRLKHFDEQRFTWFKHHKQSHSASRLDFFRWFKFTLKRPYTITHGNLLSAIWDTSHWTSFVKFGLKTA